VGWSGRYWEPQDVQLDINRGTRAIEWLCSETKVTSQLEDLIDRIGESVFSAEGDDHTTMVVKAETHLPYRISHLLLSCVESSSLRQYRRRYRIGLCARLLWVLAVSSTTEDRLTGPWRTEWCGSKMIEALQSLKDSLDLSEYFAAQGSSQQINVEDAGKDTFFPDFSAANQLRCAITVIVYRAIVDFSHRVQSGDVKIYAPLGWDVRKIFAHIQDADAAELHEVRVFMELLSLNSSSTPPSFDGGCRVLRDASGQVEVHIERAYPTITELVYPTTTELVTAERIRNEGCLTCLNDFLYFISTIWAADATCQWFVTSTAGTILQDSEWSAKETPADLQDVLRAVVQESAVLRQALAPESSLEASNKRRVRRPSMDAHTPLAFPPDIIEMFNSLLETLDSGSPLHPRMVESPEDEQAESDQPHPGYSSDRASGLPVPPDFEMDESQLEGI